ncbi:ABC transporter B family protein [Cavenderia fasciculata]|uniref:ABC transporter B family protein n=1 Tax=Cavenderia fasciculata TaxID=261658 RepID=F4PX48_CACFS|nr:ABC transporter B family protein [Cavenderia fasciculata]EGG19851.1 ABC transporter B family protein [Cavenderia fasciculata]|eukprot:XP_004358197.1 ABC transporter B family protein [Cavenderia fasciculata]
MEGEGEGVPLQDLNNNNNNNQNNQNQNGGGEGSLSPILTPGVEGGGEIKIDPRDRSDSLVFSETGTQYTDFNTKKDDKDGKDKDDKDKKEEVGPMVGFFQLFRFAEPLDMLFMIIGSISAVGAGVAMPALSIVLGQVMDAFAPSKFLDESYSLYDDVSKISVYFLYIAAGMFVLCYAEVAFWTMAGERQSVRCRKLYFRAILSQEIGWYDITKASELSTRIASDTQLFQEAIGEKVGSFLHFTSTFISGFVIGLINGWQLALVILALTPLLAAAGAFMTKMMTDLTKKGQDSYAKAGAVAEEKIGSIRTVVTFSGEERESQRYYDRLAEAMVVGKKKGVMNGIGIGLVFFILFGSYSLAFWYGSKLIADGSWNPVKDHAWTGGDVLTVFFSVIMGAMALGQAAPSVTNFANGRGAAHKIFGVIDRQSKIDPFSKKGIEIAAQGNIDFNNVSFSYPSRPDVKIFNGFNLSIKQGQTVALVGDSGGGKSSAIALLERFYDPEDGQILLDGVDIREINVSSLRLNIGLVSQEPVLFGVSIEDNIRYGNENATMEQIIDASRAANAHDFISALPEGYKTQVGEKGVQMSGGQKQRIAIARAIIKNPKILLLDEATSALDSASEKEVQVALDNVMKGRTVIVIAHRLSTIENSDIIAVVRKGQIIEQGTHDELLAKEGVYTSLVRRQQSGGDKKEQKKSGVKEIEKEEERETSDSASSSSVEGESDENLTAGGKGKRKRRGGKGKGKKGGKKKEEKSKVPIMRIARMNRVEWPYFVTGSVGALINGTIMPIFAIIFSEILKVFQTPDIEDMKRRAALLAMWFVILAIGSGVANFLQIASFTYIGEKLTHRLRHQSFRSIIRQDVGWFDLPENATGILTNDLATEATHVQGMTSQRLGLLLQNLVTTIVGLIIAFVAGWKLTLVILACVPVIGFSAKVEMDFMGGFSKEGKESYGKSSQIATEAISGIRTVAAFNAEEKIYGKFEYALADPIRLSIRKGNVAGVVFGFTQAVMFLVWALGYWYGGKLVNDGEWKAKQSTLDEYCQPGNIFGDRCEEVWDTIEGFGQMQRVFFAIVLSAMGIGNASAFAPDMAKATTATNAIFALIDRVSKIDPFAKSGQPISPADVKGDIKFANVQFAYPSRPNRQIFADFTLDIPAGKKVALVGDSGGGKSTVISLLERFYDPSAGSITLDGIEIKDINLLQLRAVYGLVGQEPFLFSGTILENIRYGKPDATLEEVIDCAKAANAHDFISALPNQYDTQLGDKFTQLSGGQKQRVAIARAIIRNPKILLLDEATSALDTVSEKEVQIALDNVMKGRTVVVIAHRLSTIINADIIAVFKGGRIVEQGSHQELLEMNGYYTKLVSRQL